MSKQPEELGGYKAMIASAFRETGDRPNGGYRRFLLVGGDVGLDAYRSWIHGTTEPQASNFALLCFAINQRLIELGKEPMLPDLPLPTTLGGGDGEKNPQPRNTDGLTSDVREQADLTHLLSSVNEAA